MWLGKKEKLRADERLERADTSKRDSRCEELDGQSRVYVSRDTKRLLLFATRLLELRHCSFSFRYSFTLIPHLPF